MVKRCLCFVVILFFFIVSAYSWQVEQFQVDDFPVQQESQAVFNLVFVPLDYSGDDEIEGDISSITTRLKSISPFNKFNGFRFFLLIFDGQKSGDIFEESKTFPYLKIRNDFIQELKDKIGGNYKLVILNKQGNASGAELSSIKETSIIILGKNSFGEKNRLTKAFLHEFGHSLGLREEYSTSIQEIIPGKPNCALNKEIAVKWWGDVAEENSGVDYFQIKSNDKIFIKPTLRSIMNDPFKSYGYGPVNERYLCEELGIECEGKIKVKVEVE